MSVTENCLTFVDEEVVRVQELLKDTAHLHTLALDSFKLVTQGQEYIESEEDLIKAFEEICRQIDAPNFSLDKEDADELLDNRMNFAEFFVLVKDYLAAVVRSVLAPDVE
jgi:hypothetical protein